MSIWTTVAEKANPYLLWIKLVAIAVILTVTFVAGWKVAAWRDAAAQEKAVAAALQTQKDEYTQRDAAYEVELEADRALLAAAGKKLDEQNARYDELARKMLEVNAKAPFVKTVTKVIHENCECPVSALSDSFRLCFNAAVGGADAAAVAACAAGGVPAAQPGGTVPPPR